MLDLKRISESPRGIFCEVLRPAGYPDCSAGGISSRYTTVLLVGDGVPEHFEARSDTPIVKLVRRNFVDGIFLHVEPIEKPAGSWNGPMSGGSFIYSCDSRFHEVSNYPLSVHDRFEAGGQ